MKQSFIKYLEAHPEQRLFQALRNWTRENVDADCNFIFIGPANFMELSDEEALNSLKDTFYYAEDRVRKGRDEDTDDN